MKKMTDFVRKNKSLQLISAVFIVFVVGSIGYLSLSSSHAQSPYIVANSCDANAKQTGGAKCQSDSTASSGSAVLFSGSTTSPPPGSGVTAGTTLFDDEFNGPAGPLTSGDSNWEIMTGDQLGGAGGDDLASNATLDGQGHLDLRIAWNGSAYTSAFITTFPYSYWPPPSRGTAVLTPPYQITMSAEMPNVSTAWPGLWLMDVNHSQAQGDNEIDVAEDYGSNTYAGCNQHFWVNGAQATPSDIPAGNTSWGSNGWSCGGESLPSLATSFHTYSADVYSDHVVYYVDGNVVGTSPHGTLGTDGTEGIQGILLDVNMVSSPGPGQGPWDMLVDYVKATSL